MRYVLSIVCGLVIGLWSACSADLSAEPQRAPQKIVVCDGNSITHGLGPNGTWPDELRNETGWDVLNIGTPMFTTSAIANYASVRVDVLRPSIVIVWEGVNSYLIDHLSPAAAYDQLRAYVSARKLYDTRPKVVTLTLLPSPRLGSFAQEYNALVRANTAAADLVVDLDKDFRLSNPFDENYFYTDHLHPIDAGFRAIGEDVSKALKEAGF